MNEEMKQALLECCERNCEVLTPAVLDFAKDLVNTAIKTSNTPIDDMFLPIINKGFDVAEEFIAEQVDKIDGVVNEAE